MHCSPDRLRARIALIARAGLYGCLAIALAGCASLGTVKSESFAVIDEEEHGYAERATNADGVVIAVRDIDNDPEGSLVFWSEAVRSSLRRIGGYALLEEGPVKTKTGKKGHRLEFGRDQDGTTYLYWVTLFVDESRIVVVEAGGRKEDFDRAKKDVEKAVTELELR